jgi:hypothetical protein
MSAIKQPFDTECPVLAATNVYFKSLQGGSVIVYLRGIYLYPLTLVGADRDAWAVRAAGARRLCAHGARSPAARVPTDNQDPNGARPTPACGRSTWTLGIK